MAKKQDGAVYPASPPFTGTSMAALIAVTLLVAVPGTVALSQLKPALEATRAPEEIARLNAERAQSEAGAQEARAALEALAGKRHNEDQALSEQQAKVSSVMTELESLTARSEQATQRNQDLEKRYAELVTQRDSLQAELTTLQRNREGLKAEITGLQRNRDGLQADLGPLTVQVDARKKVLVELEGSQQRLSDQLKTNTTQLQGLSHLAGQLEQKLVTLSNRLNKEAK